MDWSALPPIELLDGQHRKAALAELVDENNDLSVDQDFWWVVNVYDLTAMPLSVPVDLTANLATTQKEQSTGEVFRDLCSIAPELAASDVDVVAPRIGHSPTVEEYLRAAGYGEKTKVLTAFAAKLAVCSSPKTRSSLDEYRAIMATPMRVELQRFCNSGAGMEIFTLDMAYEMSLSACHEVSIAPGDERVALTSSQYWRVFFSQLNGFMEKVVPRIRHFDMKFWALLQAIQPRTEAAVNNIFWVESVNPSPSSPIAGTSRSSGILPLLSDAEYISAYRAAKRPDSLKYHLRSRQSFQYFTVHNVRALRSVMRQVIRWLIPSPESATSRNAMALEVVDVLVHGFLEVNGFERPEASAEELVNLVSDCIFEEIRSFSPIVIPSFDSYPTVATKNPTSGKTSTTTPEEYITRFRTNMAWHGFAKSVARFVRYKLEEGFMKAFNDLNYIVSDAPFW